MQEIILPIKRKWKYGNKHRVKTIHGNIRRQKKFVHLYTYIQGYIQYAIYEEACMCVWYCLIYLEHSPQRWEKTVISITCDTVFLKIFHSLLSLLPHVAKKNTHPVETFFTAGLVFTYFFPLNTLPTQNPARQPKSPASVRFSPCTQNTPAANISGAVKFTPRHRSHPIIIT